MKKGEIWWASLASPRASEPGYRRPVVVVSSDEFNQSHIATLIAAVVTSNLRLAEAPGNFVLKKKSSCLSRESVVNVSQLLTLDKQYCFEKIGKLTQKQFQTLNEGLRLVLAV